MARNTGRGSRAAAPSQQPPGGEWSDTSSRDLVVWAEPDGVVIYEGEKESARRRRVLTPAEADDLAAHLRAAARRVRSGGF